MDGRQRNCIGLGCLSLETPPGSGCFLSQLLSPQLSGRVKERPLLWQTPQVTESNFSLPEGKDLFRLPKGHLRSGEGRLHGIAPGPQDAGNQYSSHTKGYQFLPPEETQGQLAHPKKPAVHLAHLEGGDVSDDEDQESDDPGGIEGVTEEFMVCLARAVKDAQADKKCCYHCSSSEHSIHNCLLIKTLREKKQ